MSYATDGKCHNAQEGSFNHECGRPATWLGSKPSRLNPGTTFTSGYCDDCKRGGDEARTVTEWNPL